MKIPWIFPGERLPPADSAWGVNDPVPGLLAAGGALDVESLKSAYESAAFPWFNDDQPILWWSPDPRMILSTDAFVLHRSLRKKLQRFRDDLNCEIRMDHDFERVIKACSLAPREGQSGTWIVSQIVAAYCDFHRSGFAHSVETWVNGELVGGLYCVGIGRAVFGESMFARTTDASKIALAALICFCLRNGISLIDCQQNTKHLASLGATELTRTHFASHVGRASAEPAPIWRFEPVYWNELLPKLHSQTT
ncbi:MAG: leucyl/phenylalanyl-tRNA--protein transferase [Janthinobacterium lividum]